MAEQMALDYTQSVEQVIQAENATKNTPDSVHARFVFWARNNGGAIRAMRAHALRVIKRQAMHGIDPYISVHYLFEWLRYDSPVLINGTDDFKIPNEYEPIFARYLAAHDPALSAAIDLRASRFDNIQFEDLGWTA